MKQIIISVAGALLILKVVKLILPEGTVKKYASFIVSALVMLILTVSIAGNGIAFFTPAVEENTESIPDTETLEDVRKQQIVREFTRQLDEDMKKSIPELKSAELSFTFNISENNTGYVTSMTIVSPYDENSRVISRISELYMIDTDVIEWRKK